jgi:TrmH family RNA methyltransferase
MITSPDNPKVRAARALLDRKGREQQGCCLAEGVRLIEDAMRAGTIPALVFYAEQATQTSRGRDLLAAAAASGAAVLDVSPPVLETVTDTVTSQGVVAVVPIPRPVPPSVPQQALILDRLRDPGNLGTILRGAAGAGVDVVWLTAASVDPWGPKVLRAGMGAHFRLTVIEASGWDAIAGALAGRPVWLADAVGAIPYDTVDWTLPNALVIGGETLGLSVEAERIATGRIAIPMAAEVDSLNAAMAATVVLFEAARQRRNQLRPGNL